MKRRDLSVGDDLWWHRPDGEIWHVSIVSLDSRYGRVIVSLISSQYVAVQSAALRELSWSRTAMIR